MKTAGLFILFVIVFVLIFSALPARPQVPGQMAFYCFPTEFRKQLYGSGLAPTIRGLNAHNQLMEFWRDAGFNEWAVTLQDADNHFCIIGGGEQFENLIWFIPPTGDPI